MSALGSATQKMNDLGNKLGGVGAYGRAILDPLDISQNKLQQQQKKNAEDLQRQQEADAAAGADGAKPMAVRSQLLDAGSSASGVTDSGNESDIPGTPLGTRKRAARRVLVG